MLFEQIGEEDYRCTNCGAVNQIESVSFPSFGGTTEGWDECTNCGATENTSDLSAVV